MIWTNLHIKNIEDICNAVKYSSYFNTRRISILRYFLHISAFDLSNECKRLSQLEAQFRDEYMELRSKIQEFVTELVNHARTSYELEVLLNYDPEGDPWEPGQTQTLKRLRLAIKGSQKAFVTNPNIQQLLGTIWYDGLPGFRRLHVARQPRVVSGRWCRLRARR